MDSVSLLSTIQLMQCDRKILDDCMRILSLYENDNSIEQSKTNRLRTESNQSEKNLDFSIEFVAKKLKQSNQSEILICTIFNSHHLGWIRNPINHLLYWKRMQPILEDTIALCRFNHNHQLISELGENFGPLLLVISLIDSYSLQRAIEIDIENLSILGQIQERERLHLYAMTDHHSKRIFLGEMNYFEHKKIFHLPVSSNLWRNEIYFEIVLSQNLSQSEILLSSISEREIFDLKSFKKLIDFENENFHLRLELSLRWVINFDSFSSQIPERIFLDSIEYLSASLFHFGGEYFFYYQSLFQNFFSNLCQRCDDIVDENEDEDDDDEVACKSII
ncbi:hypothetical protein NH340_JMT05605 [Sarcoptes scabiei]|nr:hypothetical protein NH340_JMT05605 [Sarcoptes scabiei]